LCHEVCNHATGRLWDPADVARSYDLDDRAIDYVLDQRCGAVSSASFEEFCHLLPKRHPSRYFMTIMRRNLASYLDDRARGWYRPTAAAQLAYRSK
jgi:hypothetical protein